MKNATKVIKEIGRNKKQFGFLSIAVWLPIFYWSQQIKAIT